MRSEFTLISMQLPELASIFTADVWAVIKVLELIKDSDASRYIILYRLAFMSPGFAIYETSWYLLLYCLISVSYQYQFTIQEGNVLFNDTLNTFYLRLYGVGHMVQDHSDNEKGNPLLFSINSNGSFISTIPKTG